MSILAPAENHRLFSRPPRNKRESDLLQSQWQEVIEDGKADAIVACLVSRDHSRCAMQDIGLTETLAHQLTGVNDPTVHSSRIRKKFSSYAGTIEFRTERFLRHGDIIYRFHAGFLFRFFVKQSALLASPYNHRILEIEGVGDNYEDALDDYTAKFHLLFSSLGALHPDAMSPHDEILWNRVSSIVDIASHDPVRSCVTADEQFDELVAVWQRETKFMSSVADIVENSAYQQIVEMGERAVPLILADLARHPTRHWYVALTKILNHNPVPRNQFGDLKRMSKQWLEWANQNGYCIPNINDQG